MWSKPTDYHMRAHRMTYGRTLDAMSQWPLRHIFDEIVRLNLEIGKIICMPANQPILSPRIQSRQWVPRKGQNGPVCVPIPEDQICLCCDDDEKVVCDHPLCPACWSVDLPFDIASVTVNKQYKLIFNQVRIRCLMEFARQRIESV